MAWFKKKNKTIPALARQHIKKTPTFLLGSFALVAAMGAAASMTAGLPALLGAGVMMTMSLMIIMTLHLNHHRYAKQASKLDRQEKGLSRFGKGIYMGMYALAATTLLMAGLMATHLLLQPVILTGFSSIFAASVVAVILCATASAACMAYLHPHEASQLLGRLAGEAPEPTTKEQAQRGLRAAQTMTDDALRALAAMSASMEGAGLPPTRPRKAKQPSSFAARALRQLRGQ